ncbi:alpha-ketoglutarate decarboxylase [Streptomyces aurantiacus]|uniref:Alpha-ketoglutarate decarboxylase n=1 Tax=Streptomyces aurantiacus TaxID=47760 RepID=A0A7G1P0D8_9ACTN|nr:alpha-ketoglutarate decarboxylase [Streptomyces aurantiacus]
MRILGVASASAALTLGLAGNALACNISEFSAVAKCDGTKGVISVTDKDPSGVKAKVSVFRSNDGGEKLVGEQEVEGTREGVTIDFSEDWKPNTTYRVHVKAGNQVDEDIKGGLTTPSEGCESPEESTPPASPSPSEKPSQEPSSPSDASEAPKPSAAESSPAASTGDNAPSPAGDSNLAETGSSSNTGAIAGIAAALVAAGAGVMFALRRRGAANNR